MLEGFKSRFGPAGWISVPASTKEPKPRKNESLTKHNAEMELNETEFDRLPESFKTVIEDINTRYCPHKNTVKDHQRKYGEIVRAAARPVFDEWYESWKKEKCKQ